MNFWSIKINFNKSFNIFICLFIFNTINSQQKNLVNLTEKLKAVGIPVSKLEISPLLSLTDYNYKIAAFSNDLKYMAVSRSYYRKESEIMDVVLIRLKNAKETVLIDTQTMIRYGRPNGYLNHLYFNEEDILTATIGDGMEGVSILTFDPEKKEIIKDEYIDDYYNEEGEEDIEEEIKHGIKIADLKRIFPKKTNIQLTNLSYKLLEVDTVGYLTQGILYNSNSVFYLPHANGKLRLLHDFSDPTLNDNIDGVWGTSSKAFYLIKDKKNDYFFKYDVNSNVVTLLEKYPPHSHYTYISSCKLKNGDVFLWFDVEIDSSEADETIKLFRYRNGHLMEIEGYPLLQEVNYLSDRDILLLYYLKDGKRCLDIRLLNLGLPGSTQSGSTKDSFNLFQPVK